MRQHQLLTSLVIAFCIAAKAASAVSPALSADDAIKQGDDLLADDKVAQALSAYEGAVKAKPSNSSAHQRLGRAYALQRKLTHAAAELNKAIELDKKNATAHVDLGWVYGMQGAYQSSISEERAAIALDPRNPSGYLNLGVALTHENEYDAATVAFRNVLVLDPQNPVATYNAAALLARQGKFAEAVYLYRRAVALNQSNFNAHLGLAAALGKLGQIPGEVQELKLASALAPNNASAHGRLGWALYRVGDYGGALLHGITANGLRMKGASSQLFGTLALISAGLLFLFGIIFSALMYGTKFVPKSDEKILRSFFLVFYRDRPGRFVITSRRLVYVPEAISEWLGATRLSFDYVDIERFHGSNAFRGGKLSLLCTNGTVYHFAMPAIVLEPMIEELRKITFGAEEEMVDATASQLALKQIKINRAKVNPPAEKKEEAEGPIITVVDLPENFKNSKTDKK